MADGWKFDGIEGGLLALRSKLKSHLLHEVNFIIIYIYQSSS